MWPGDVAAGASTRAKGDETTKRLRVRLREGFAPSSRLTAHGPPLPIWITEAGLNAVDPDDFLNPVRRQLQADFTGSTARQALAHPDVAMFMPFILVHQGDGHALTMAADKPLPAWDAYAAFTRANPWPQRPLARVPENPNPIVVQWLPDNKTTIPHKVSGTYRFLGNRPIVGEIRVYNFGEAKRTGHLRLNAAKDVAVNGGPSATLDGLTVDGSVAAGASTRPDMASRVEDPKVNDSEIEGRAERPAPPRRTGPVRSTLDISTRAVKDNRPYQSARRSGPTPELISQTQEPKDIAVPAMSMVAIPVTITPATAGYFREYLTFEFVDETGCVSPLYFGVERTPVEGDFEGGSLELTAGSLEGDAKKPEGGRSREAEMASQQRWPKGPTEPVAPQAGEEADLTERKARRWRSKPEGSDPVAARASTRRGDPVDGGPAATVDGRRSDGRAVHRSRSTDSLSTVHRADEVRFPLQDDYTVTSTSGPWVGINGLQLAEPPAMQTSPVRSYELGVRGRPNQASAVKREEVGGTAEPSVTSEKLGVKRLSIGTHNQEPLTLNSRTRLRAHTPLVENDPLRQTLAVARIAGLPKTGFIYLKTNRPMTADFYVRVDLLDRQGQRFAIWENLGVSYYGPQNEAWLNLEDFQHYIWTGVTTNPRLDPTQVEEIQLRFYFKKANDPVEVEVEIRQPRRLPVRS